MKSGEKRNSSTTSNTSEMCIKQSVSMTSLPPNASIDGSEQAILSLKFERPYNSLKKKRSADTEIWRHSFGSGLSHSSCSLLSNTTGFAICCGKDEFWAALQTNYNYIMDTNLMDSCKEAHGELERPSKILTNANILEDQTHVGISASTGPYVDPRVLRKWLRQMEDKISQAPTLSEASHMDIIELKRRLSEHSVLYCEIVSHARVVGACIKASSKDSEQSEDLFDRKSPSFDFHKSFYNNLDGLERRYHLLYLKAIEIQCLYEGLVVKKNSMDYISTDSDDEPACKLARPIEAYSKLNLTTNCSQCEKENSIRPTTSKENFKTNLSFQSDADSERSENEAPLINTKTYLQSFDCSVKSKSADISSNSSIVEDPLRKQNEFISPVSSSPRSDVNKVDTTQFQRSNRKSSNCATFYFKHLETDTENLKNTSEQSFLRNAYFKEDRCTSKGQCYSKKKHTPDSDKADKIPNISNINSSSPIRVQIVNEHAVFDNKESKNEDIQNASTSVRPLETIRDTIKNNVLCNQRRLEKSDVTIVDGKIEKVQEWLDQQSSVQKTDCEASGEYTDSETSDRPSVSSEGLTDSVATCMQNENFSQGASAEIIGDPADVLLNPVPRRTNRPNSDRPWSVSCLSQLKKEDVSKHGSGSTAQRIGYSNSESALHEIGSPSESNEALLISIRHCSSKCSVKRRRRRRISDKKSDVKTNLSEVQPSILHSEKQCACYNDEIQFMKELENVRSRSFFSKSAAYNIRTYLSRNSVRTLQLGSKSSNPSFMSIDKGECPTGTDDYSSFSEQAWDNYQEKYNSENYSEGMDSDAARKLLEFGDDYRNFLDSQSDCCSSTLSAANNLESLSPPKWIAGQLVAKTQIEKVDHIRRRRPHELQNDRKKQKERDMTKKIVYECPNDMATLKFLPSALTNRQAGSNDFMSRLQVFSSFVEKFQPNSELRRRKSVDSFSSRGKSARLLMNLQSSSDGSDEENELIQLLNHNQKKLENAIALKPLCFSLKANDFAEMFATCKSNIQWLEALHGSSVLSKEKCNQIKELLLSWEFLLTWSVNAAMGAKMREELQHFKSLIRGIGRKNYMIESESSFHDAIDELKVQKANLQTYRNDMLRLNSSVHSWITRQELEVKRDKHVENNLGGSKVCQLSGEELISTNEFHRSLKDIVRDLYQEWDDADSRVSKQIEMFTNSLACWRKLSFGLSEFIALLAKDRAALNSIHGALSNRCPLTNDLTINIKEAAQMLSKKLSGSFIQGEVSKQIGACRESEDKKFVPMQPKTFIASSSGSLSDSGISDGGALSDAGSPEREQRLSILRRLAKQLESTFEPESKALKSVITGMQAAESELKILQNICREIIIRTTLSDENQPSSYTNGLTNRCPLGKKFEAKMFFCPEIEKPTDKYQLEQQIEFQLDRVPNESQFLGTAISCVGKRPFICRVAKIAIPIQIAILTLFCAACLLQPHCCDSLNNFSMSFTPQLRYLRGPPPI